MRTLLHVGCGPKYKQQTTAGFNSDEWSEIRLDVDATVNPDVLGSMTDMSTVANESVDAVFSSHNIEHLYPHEVPVALAEIVRVLKPDGFLVVVCPDLQAAAKWIAEDRMFETAYESPAGPVTPFDMVYSHRSYTHRDKPHQAHHSGFSKSTLQATMLANGFKTAGALSSGWQLHAIASKRTLNNEELQALAAQYLLPARG